MEFWIFMLIMNLLIPFTMIGFGKFFISKAGPKEINMLFGYRTSMSMKNKETWTFAHLYFGKLWWRIGWIMLPISAVLMILLIGKGISTVGLLGSLICMIQGVFLILPIIPTERALRKNFDIYGFRR